MVKVIQADLVSIRGMRNVIDGEAEILQGFEFNNRSTIQATLFAPFQVEVDRAEGELKFIIESFVPQTMIAAPGGTTHFKVVSIGAEINFENETFVVATSETAMLPWDNTPTALITQTNVVAAASTKPLFLVVGVEFYQDINNEMYPLKNGASNPLSLIKVDGGV
ncbi:MAG: hypothetical protein EOO43_22050 [Flavobacterium sp.]|nr:MAG: hypothetical protein EOO43_22050 [Flavobacterium sp.]